MHKENGSKSGIISPSIQSTVKNFLPNPDFPVFIGRHREFNEVINILKPYPDSQHHVISLDGVGGVGKTALALEVAYHYVRDNSIIPPQERFDAVIWTSAKKNILTPSGIVSRSQALRNINDIFIAIAQTLEKPEILSSDPEQQHNFVKHALSKQRVLIIIDNLETIDDSKVFSFLRELPAPTKAIITTRYRTVDGALPIRIKGMEKGDILTLIESECEKRGVKLTVDQRNELAKKTAGVPLAVVWTIGQISKGHPIDKALLRLASASKDYAKFVFSESLELLRAQNKNSAIKLLLALSLFADGASSEGLGFVCGLRDLIEERNEGLSTLLELSLINDENGRFTMLPLTKEYASAELAQDLEFLREATDRWFNWHVLLAEQGGGGKLDLDASVLQALITEHTNILWAINASFTHDRFDIFVRLLKGMGFFWVGTGYWNDYETYYNKGRMLAPNPNDRIHFSVRLIWLNILRQNLLKAGEMLAFAKDLLQQFPNRYEEMRLEDYTGQLNMELGKLDIAEEHLRISLEIAREIKDRRGQFACLKYLGELFCRRNDPEKAREMLKDAEPYAIGTGEDQWIRGMAHAAQLKGLIGLVEEKWDDAVIGFQNCIDYLGIWPDERLLTRARLGLAFAHFFDGRREKAKELLELNLATFSKLGMTQKNVPAEDTFTLWQEKKIVGFWESM